VIDFLVQALAAHISASINLHKHHPYFKRVIHKVDKQSNLTQESFNGHPAYSRPTKRARTDIDIGNLPNEQKDILAQAAAILKVPINEVPDTVRRLHIPPTFTGETRRRSQHQANRTMGGGPDNPREADSMRGLASPEHNSGGPPVEGDLPADMTSTPNSYAVESCFGFEVVQSKWPDCLSGFALPEQCPSDEAGQCT
jgi:hypothetical protein